MNFTDHKDIWHYLSAQREKKIVMYGMGNGADKILAVCEKYGIEVSDFFASDGFVRGHSFHGKTVLSYSEVKQKYGAGNIIVLLSFASSLPSVIELIEKVSSECELYAPDVPVCGDNLFCADFYNSNLDKIKAAQDLFADNESLRIFNGVVFYKLYGDIRALREAESSKDEVYRDLICKGEVKTAIDAGAYNGDTVRELKYYSPTLERVYALEPDRRNFRKLSEYAAAESNIEVIPLQYAAWNEKTVLEYDASGNRNSGVNPSAKKTVSVNADKIDSITNEKIDYIKYDVEGSEREALLGSAETIRKHRPVLLVSAYHRSEDIFELPALIHEIEPSYKLYLRRYRYIPAWDLNIIAIPE